VSKMSSFNDKLTYDILGRVPMPMFLIAQCKDFNWSGHRKTKLNLNASTGPVDEETSNAATPDPSLETAPIESPILDPVAPGRRWKGAAKDPKLPGHLHLV